MKHIQSLKNLFVALLLVCPMVMMAQDIQTKAIKFAKGKSSASVSGTVTGYQVIDYVVAAKKGQTLKVSLKTNKTSNFFNILAPGSQDEAFFNSSSTGQNTYSGSLDKDGNYKVRVYLFRNAARNKVKATYTLAVSVLNK